MQVTMVRDAARYSTVEAGRWTMPEWVLLGAMGWRPRAPTNHVISESGSGDYHTVACWSTEMIEEMIVVKHIVIRGEGQDGRMTMIQAACWYLADFSNNPLLLISDFAFVCRRMECGSSMKSFGVMQISC
jgi:hypothetical protein